jgi:hypothetical protein
MQMQDTSKFNNAGIDGDYIFGLAGSFANGERTGAAGRLTANGSGGASNEKIDLDLAGSITSDAGFTSPIRFLPGPHQAAELHRLVRPSAVRR